MRILVDGDAFPDLNLVVALAKKYQKEIIIYVDSEHEINLDVKIIRVCKGNNAVDTALENDVGENDIVLTQDYGVAVICLSKRAFCINPLGYSYKEETISSLLEIKSYKQKLRRHTHIKGPKKRTKDDTKKLLLEIEKVIKENEKESS
jgi:hypothetical protein